ncbi:MAG: hypothetical protein AB1894_20525 [Chloroflexota bacterium]
MKKITCLAYALLLSLFVFTSACSGTVATNQPPTLTPVVVVTRYVTQVVATQPPPLPTAVPTSTPYPTAAGGWNPYSMPIHYPLPGCIASRLHLGDMAYVDTVGFYGRLYIYTDFFYDPGRRDLAPGESLFIEDGPWCVEDYLVWKVWAPADKLSGYVVEGNGESYWIFPLPSTVSTPKPTPKPTKTIIISPGGG